jgi:hypothetical protein
MSIFGARLGRSLAAALLLLAVASASQAVTLTLDDLVSGNATFDSGNGLLTFSDFKISRRTRLSGDLTLYSVEVLQDGFRLSSSEFSVTSGGLRKLDLSYKVAAKQGSIVGAGMTLLGSSSSGRVKVEKDIEDPSSDEGTFLVTLIRNSATLDNDSDTFSPGGALFEVEESIRIKKIATIGSVTNTYTVAAEPTELSLLAAGLSGLAWLGRRRSRRS